MKLALRLSDADRERFGCPEWIDLDLMSLSAREVLIMQSGFTIPETGQFVGFKTLDDFRRAAVGGDVVKGDDGKPVMVDEEDDDGNPVLDDEGQPVRRPLRVPNFAGDMFLTWFALRRAGITVPLAEFDYDMGKRQFRVVHEEDEAVGEGKDPSTPLTTSQS